MVRGDRLIRRQIENFQARTNSESAKYTIATQAVATDCSYSLSGNSIGKFKGIAVGVSSVKEKIMCKNQFYQALADSLKAKLLCESEKDISNSLM